MSANKLKPGLIGIPETALLTLWSRAKFATGANPLLDDPLAVDLTERIDYAFQSSFGRPILDIAIRSQCFDEHIRRFLAKSPAGPVIALGEGLETQFWRVDNGKVCWYSVDLPEVIDLRRHLLPAHERNILTVGSVLDAKWLEKVPTDAPVFITAAGLFMYLERKQVHTLLRQIVQRFARGQLVFDTVSRWFSRKTLKGFNPTGGYTYPPMPFGLALPDVPDFMAEIPQIQSSQVVAIADSYSRPSTLFKRFLHIPWVKNYWSSGLVHAVW